MTTTFTCAWDGRVLYTSRVDYKRGDAPRAADLIPGEGIPEPKTGTVVVCPDCEAADPRRETFVMAASPRLEKPVPVSSWTPIFP